MDADVKPQELPEHIKRMAARMERLQAIIEGKIKLPTKAEEGTNA